MLKIIAIVILTWFSVSIGLALVWIFFGTWLRGGEVHKTFEAQDGMLYLYSDGQLTHILHDSPSQREFLEKLGYVQHNKFQRNGRRL